MFGSLGWGEILVLLAAALIIFGPDRLPSLARDLAHSLRQFRNVTQNAKSQIRTELGSDFSDFDFQSLNPKTFVRKHLLDDDPVVGGQGTLLADLGQVAHDGTTTAMRTPQKPLAPGETAPFDPDAT